ncbi:MAG: hypothetical protein ACLUDU_13700 [Butyricimonas faecihominis]
MHHQTERNRVSQVINNFITNAIKLPTGEYQARLQAIVTRHALFLRLDTGCGIAPTKEKGVRIALSN